MEFTIHYFWILKVITLLLAGFFIWMWFEKYKLTRKVTNKWLIAYVVFMVLSFINPIKIDGTNSKSTVNQINNSIEAAKELPQKEIDDSFKKATNKDLEISKSLISI